MPAGEHLLAVVRAGLPSPRKRRRAYATVWLAVEIRRAVHGHRASAHAYVALTRVERERVDAVLQDWLGETDPD